MKEIKPSDLDKLLTKNNKHSSSINHGPIVRNSMLERMFNDELSEFTSIPLIADEAILKLKDIFTYIHNGSPIMFISACHGLNINEKHTNKEIKENNEINKAESIKLNNDLDRICRVNNWLYIKVNGHWIQHSKQYKKFIDTPEYSFMVIAAGRDQYISNSAYKKLLKIGIELCNKYDQECVMVGKKIIEEGKNNLDKDNFDFSYYEKDGNRSFGFTKYSIENPEDIKNIAERYTKELNAYIKTHDIEDDRNKEEYEKIKGQSHGATGIIDIDNNNEIDIVFESFTVKNKLPSRSTGIWDSIATI